MSKYHIAKEAIAQAIEHGQREGWNEEEILQALITSCIGFFQASAGSDGARSLLNYELANVSDRLDLDFIRSR